MKLGKSCNDLSDILESPELVKIVEEKTEKYPDLIQEWWNRGENGDKEPLAISELKEVCNKKLSLKAEYKRLIIEEYSVRIFYDALIGFNEEKDANFRTYFWLTARSRSIDVVNFYGKKNREEMHISPKSFDETGDDGKTFGETYCDETKETTEEESIRELSGEYGEFSETMQDFLNKLSTNARNVLTCLVDGKVKKDEIKKHLKLSDKEYEAAKLEIRRKRASVDMIALKQSKLGTNNKEIISNKEEIVNKVEECNMTTKEKNKVIATSVRDFLEDVNRKYIRTDLSVQRVQGIWSPEMVGNLITTVLSGYPFPNIICAEDGRSGDVYIIDGGQRTDALNRFMNNLININKKSEHLEITYDEPEYDENGNIKEGENGFAIVHPVTVNVGGMYFRDLPTELQRLFLKGQVMVEKYLACTMEDMEWHMRRYNNMKPMTASQKGLTYLGMDLSKSVIKVTKESEFFKNFNIYTKLSSKSYLNGDVNRIINEAVMAINFLDQWLKKQTDLNSFLKINGTKEMVSEINNLLDRLVDAGVSDVKEMFTSKNSFIWITLFKKYTDLNLESDKLFINFMKEFTDSLHEKELNGTTYDILDKKASKDKTTVIAKINHLEGLMNEYFNIDGDTPENDDDDDDTEPVDISADINEEVSTEVNTSEEKIILDDLIPETDEIPLDDSIKPDVSILITENPIEVETAEIEETETTEYPLPRIEDDTIINQPVKEAEWIKKEEDAKNGINPNAELLRDYVDDYYDNEYASNIRDMYSDTDSKRMAIEALLMYSNESDLSFEHLIEYCKTPFVNSHIEKMKDIVNASREVSHYSEKVKDTAIFEDYENYPVLTLLMIYLDRTDKFSSTEDEIVEWLDDVTPRFDEVCNKAVSKVDMVKAMVIDLKNYEDKRKTTMVEKKKVNLDF